MMRSLFSGVAGLKTHQTKMDVIGNNIANVNTTAYKSSSIVFNDLMSQTTQKASGPNATTGTGGTNARQIGLGVKTGAININITGQGASQSTGNPFDIMMTGENFFVVSNGRENFFTRDGSFYVDAAGNLAMTSTGYNVMGWQVDEETGDIRQDTVTALRIMSVVNKTYPPEATSKAYAGGILDKNDKDVTSMNGKTINLNFYDNLGYSYTARFTFKQSDDVNNYSLEFTKLLDSTGKEVDISSVKGGMTPVVQEKTQSVVMNKNAYAWAGGELKNLGGTPLICNPDAPAAEQVTFVMADLKGWLTTAPTAAEDIRKFQLMKDTLAKAYGFEGSTDEFFNLVVDVPNPLDATPDASGVYATKKTTYIEELIKDNNPSIAFPDSLAKILNAEKKTSPNNSASGFTAAGRRYVGDTISFNPNNGTFAGINGQPTVNGITLALSKLGGNFSDIEIDFSTISMVDNKGTSTVGATSGDIEGLGTGRRLGDMIGVSIQNNGMIYASYDNGMTRLLGQIATAAFANASGLEKAGDNLYSATMNSGEFDGVGVDVTASGGYMSTGQLEMSNVDLSTEFTQMITTQRGFQANSRIITVSDSLLEELANLKR